MSKLERTILIALQILELACIAALIPTHHKWLEDTNEILWLLPYVLLPYIIVLRPAAVTVFTSIRLAKRETPLDDNAAYGGWASVTLGLIDVIRNAAAVLAMLVMCLQILGVHMGAHVIDMWHPAYYVFLALPPIAMLRYVALACYKIERSFR